MRDLSKIVIENHEAAKEVLEVLRATISRTGAATIADLYDLVGLISKFDDNRWGWTDLRTAGIKTVQNGYSFDLPQTVSLI